MWQRWATILVHKDSSRSLFMSVIITDNDMGAAGGFITEGFSPDDNIMQCYLFLTPMCCLNFILVLACIIFSEVDLVYSLIWFQLSNTLFKI